MKHRKENPLLDEIIGNDALTGFRRASLDRGLDAMRRERRRHQVARAGALVLLPLLLLIMAFVWIGPAHQSAGPRAVQVPHATRVAASTPAMAPVKSISDDELFALFPGRSMALIGRPGNQELVFLDTSSGN